MAKPPKKLKPEDIEIESGAWDRFKRTMDRMVPPKSRPVKKTKTARKRKTAK